MEPLRSTATTTVPVRAAPGPPPRAGEAGHQQHRHRQEQHRGQVPSPTGRGATRASSGSAAKRTACRRRRRLGQQVYATRRTSTPSSSHSRSGERKIMILRPPHGRGAAAAAPDVRPPSPPFRAAPRSGPGRAPSPRPVDTTRCSAPARRTASALASRSSRAAAANRRRTLRDDVSTSCVGPGLRVDERHHPDVRDLELARVEHLDDDHPLTRRQPSQRPRPASRSRIEQVGDDEPQAPATVPGERPMPSARLTAGHRPCRFRGDSASAAQHSQPVHPAAAVRPGSTPVGGQHLGTELVTAAVRDVGEGDRHRGREVSLLHRGGAEVHRRGGVHQCPRASAPGRRRGRAHAPRRCGR